MTCYPCNLCNKCGQFGWLRERWGKCPGCGGSFERGEVVCKACGHTLPLPPGMSEGSVRKRGDSAD